MGMEGWFKKATPEGTKADTKKAQAPYEHMSVEETLTNEKQIEEILKNGEFLHDRMSERQPVDDPRAYRTNVYKYKGEIYTVIVNKKNNETIMATKISGPIAKMLEHR